MYWKDNKKYIEKSIGFGDGYHFPYYEFSRNQHLIEVGQILQRIYYLYRQIDELLINLESEHGPLKSTRYDKATGFTGTSAIPIHDFIDETESKYLLRLLKELYKDDLPRMITVEPTIKDLRPYRNVIESLKFIKEQIASGKEYKFDYLTLDGLRRHLIDLWDLVRKSYDDMCNDVEVPDPTIDNREFFKYFLLTRDCYCNQDKEMALAIVRKAIEDVLTRLWILSFDSHTGLDLTKRPNLDNLPGNLKSRGVISEQEFREIQPLIKFGNSGIHIIGEISDARIESDALHKINEGISLVDNLSRKYYRMMTDNNYGGITFSKIGYSIEIGKRHAWIRKPRT